MMYKYRQISCFFGERGSEPLSSAWRGANNNPWRGMNKLLFTMTSCSSRTTWQSRLVSRDFRRSRSSEHVGQFDGFFDAREKILDRCT